MNRNQARPRQRWFAKFMAGNDEQSFEQYRTRKDELFAGIRGRVLEIGPGTGVNLPFYPREIEWVGVEPNPAMHPYLEERAAQTEMRVELRGGLAPEKGIEPGSFDFVVSTLVLCSVSRLEETLHQIHAALKPEGKFLFLEHEVDHRNRFRRLVQKCCPYTPWRYLSGGCEPGRDLATPIERAGFGDVDFERYEQDGEGIISWINRSHICGFARK